MNVDPTNLLNKRSEIFAKCRHREKWWAAKFKRAREPDVDDARHQIVENDISNELNLIAK